MGLFSEHQQSILELQVRKKIYQLILRNQGCHLRDLERKSKIPLTTLRHHLHYLSRNGLLKEEKEGSNTRYFTQEFSTKQRTLLALLRQTTVRRMLIIVIIKENPTHKEISEFARVSPATTTFHLKKLSKKGILKEIKKGKEKHYSLLIPKKDIIYLLLAYKQSFVDRILDNAVEMWEL